jgi:hypothetical protein
MKVEDLELTDDEVLAEAQKIKAEGRANPFSAGNYSHEMCDAILTKAVDIEKARGSAIAKDGKTD